MPLKIDHISRQLDQMARSMVDLALAEQNLLSQAQELLRSVDANALRQKLEWQRAQQSRIPWLVAIPGNSLARYVSAPVPPSSYCVLGADGSSIPPDRHSSVQYYVLNVGYAALCYGQHAGATLQATSQLCYLDQDLYIFPDRRDVPIEGVLLDARMEVESLRILHQAMQDLPRPAVALRDGPLILWTLQGESQEVKQALLRDLVQGMAALRDMGTPLAGYISYTGSRDVANSLRVWLCQGQPNQCEQCRSEKRELCLALAGILDRDLFAFLPEGARSDVFGSSSQILEEYKVLSAAKGKVLSAAKGGEHQVEFFFVNVGGEIVRIEVPQWVTADITHLNLLHAIVYDQCRRSSAVPPYPPALLEAHEQAVISTTERRIVEEMVEKVLGLHGKRVVRSAKDYSKRRRGV